MSSTILDYEDLISTLCTSPTLSKEEILTLYTKFENLGKNSSNIEQKLISATFDCVLGNTKQAQDILISLLPLSCPRLSFYVNLVLGYLFMNLEKFENSIEYFLLAKTLSYTSKYPFILHNLAVDAFIKSRNYEQGVSYILSIDELHPEHSPVFHCKLGFFYEKLGALSLAQKCFSAAGSMNFELAAVCQLWAEVLAAKNVSEKFENLFTSFESNFWKMNDLKYLNSLNLIKTNQYQEAVNILSQFTLFNLKDSYLIALGFAFFKLNNITQAFTFTVKGLKANPKNAEGWFNLAVIYNRVQQEESKNALIRAQKLGLGIGVSLEDLVEPILPTIELWNFGSQGSKEPEKPKKNNKQRTKPSELPKIVVPVPVKTANIEINFGHTFQFFQCMLMMQEAYKRNFEMPQESKDFIEYNEPANILTRLKLPSKRQR